MEILRGGEITKLVDVVLGRRRRAEVAEPDSVTDQNRLDAALLRYAILRLDDLLRQDLEPPDEIIVDRADIPLLQRLLAEKTCGFQHHDGRDLYCSVAGDVNAVAVGLRLLAPTSRALCNACTLPATDYLCSHLHHPKVGGLTRFKEERPDGQGGLERSGPYLVREVYFALCDLDKPDIANPDRCRPGGNLCWERVVESEVEEAPHRPAPLAVPEALDHLALAWEVTFGRPLFRQRSIVTDAGLAVVECGTIAELESLLSKLADVFNAMVIEDDLLPSGGAPIEKSHSLARLLAAVKKEAPPEKHADIDGAVGMLQAINAVRIAYQHQERRVGLIDAFRKLRLEWPSESPGQAWDGIRARTIEAVGTIRDATRGLVPYRERGHQTAGRS
jgi:hypothetical protein